MLTIAWVDHTSSDWYGIYRDSSKVYEGHPDQVHDILDHTGIDVLELFVDDLDRADDALEQAADTTELSDKLIIVWSDYIGSDFYALYRNGERLYTGHPHTPDELLDLLDVDYDQIIVDSTSLTDQSRLRGMPDTLPTRQDALQS